MPNLLDTQIASRLRTFGVASRRERRRIVGKDRDGVQVNPDKCFADFLYRVAKGDDDTLASVYKTGRTRQPTEKEEKSAELREKATITTNGKVTKAALVGTSGQVGGYLIPQELSYAMMLDVAEESYLLDRCLTVHMESQDMRLSLPNATTAQTAGTSPFFGGLLMQWMEDGTTFIQTEQTYNAVALHAWDLGGYVLASNPLLQDGGMSLEGWLRSLFARSVRWYLEYAAFQGNGVGKPIGLINAAASKAVTRGTGGNVKAADLGTMSSALTPSCWARSCWFCHPTVIAQLVTIGAQYLLNQSYYMGDGGAYPTFLLDGRPGYVSEKCSTLGTAGDVLLIDPTLYVVGDRLAIEISLSQDEPTAFLNNQSVWRLLWRGDGQPFFSTPITVADGATVTSPYVVLH
jgi:HK97 family phage major capsid protein